MAILPPISVASAAGSTSSLDPTVLFSGDGQISPERLLVVSNRLPVTITQNETDSSWMFAMSSGGLVSALSGLKKEMSFNWIGWPGESSFLEWTLIIEFLLHFL